MMDNKEENKYTCGEGVFILCLFATFWITIEDPDVIDAIIFFLMK